MKAETRKLLIGILMIILALFDYKTHYFSFGEEICFIIGGLGIYLVTKKIVAEYPQLFYTPYLFSII